MTKLKDAMNTQCATTAERPKPRPNAVKSLMTSISRGLDAVPGSSTAVKKDDEESKKTS